MNEHCWKVYYRLNIEKLNNCDINRLVHQTENIFILFQIEYISNMLQVPR